MLSLFGTVDIAVRVVVMMMVTVGGPGSGPGSFGGCWEALDLCSVVGWLAVSIRWIFEVGIER